jgi:hypothetical protein
VASDAVVIYKWRALVATPHLLGSADQQLLEAKNSPRGAASAIWWEIWSKHLFGAQNRFGRVGQLHFAALSFQYACTDILSTGRSPFETYPNKALRPLSTWHRR